MYRILPIILALALTLAGCGAAEQTKTQGDLTITFATEPTTPIADRPTTLRVVVARAGAPLDGVRVTLQRAMAGMPHPDDAGMLIAQPLGAGAYAAQTAFAMGSRWDVTVAVTSGAAPPEQIVFPIEVEQP